LVSNFRSLLISLRAAAFTSIIAATGCRQPRSTNPDPAPGRQPWFHLPSPLLAPPALTIKPTCFAVADTAQHVNNTNAREEPVG
jgi:hypothetical protein